jgi:hypothetical protein
MATKLADGTVLVAGGVNTTDVGVSELYAQNPPAPYSLQITPAVATMVIGGTQRFTVVDSLGHPRDEATWIVSNPSLATITTDSAPTLTAVADGSVTLTASVQGVNVDAQVTILATSTFPAGSIRFTVPTAGASTSPKQLLQATGSGSETAFFATSASGGDTWVQGVSADGQQLWQTLLASTTGVSVPDAFGGLLVPMYVGCDHVNPMRVRNIDGPTGLPLWEVVGTSSCTTDAPQMAIRHDGVIFMTTAGNTSGFPELMIVDGASGQILSAPAIPPSTFEDSTGQQLTGYSRVGPPLIDGDGSAFLEYEVRHVAFGFPPFVTTAAIWLMKIDVNGTTTTTQLTTTDTNTNLFPGRIIPDGLGGVIATWTFSPAQPPADPNPLRAARVTAAGTVTPYNLPLQPAQVLISPSGLPVNPDVLLGATNSAFFSYGSDLVSFNVDTGVANWTYSVAPSQIKVLVADSTDGVVAKRIDADSETVVRLSSAGDATPDSWSGSGIDYSQTWTWLGQVASTSMTVYEAPGVPLSPSGFAQNKGANQATQKITLTSSPQSSGPDWDTILSVFQKVKTALDAEPSPRSCSTWLASGGTNGSSIIQTLFLAGHRFGHVSLNVPTVIAFVGGKNSDFTFIQGLPDTWSVTVNSTGSFFQPVLMPDGTVGVVGGYRLKDGQFTGYANATLQGRASTLIHETAHIIKPIDAKRNRVFQSDLGNSNEGALNDQAVHEYCGTLINSLQ